MPTLAEHLARETREAELYRPLDRNRVECFACGHRCPIRPGFAGVCKVRFNRDGKLYAPYGYVNAAYSDPIEKKPFFHALPGTRALSFGMLGCDLHCGYCQNWVSSQALRDFRSTLDFAPATPQELVKLALRAGRSSLVSTYNEPLITAEWAVAVFREAKAAGLTTGFRLQRQRHAGSAGVHPPVGGPLQGRSQELRRPPLSRAGRAHRADSRFHRAAFTRWVSGWKW